MKRFAPLWLPFAFLFALPATAQEERPPDPPAQPPVAEAETRLDLPLHGSATLRYRFRSTGDDRDQDVDQYLSADLGEPDRNTVTAHLFLRGSEDLDGDRDPDGFFVFDNISDTYDKSVHARLYYGHVDLNRYGPFDKVRAGRQIMSETPLFLYHDGLWAESAEWKDFFSLQGGLYGGIPVHLYESSTSGDSLFGGYVQGSPWPKARVRFDYTRARDSYLDGTARDDFLAIALRQNVGGSFRVQAQHSILERENRELTGRIQYSDAEADLQVQFSYTELFNTQKRLTLDFDSFFFAAQEFFPYRQARVLASKGLGERVRLEAGADVRELRDEDDEAPLNREFRRFHITTHLLDSLAEDFDLSATIESWDVPGTESGDIVTGGLDATHVVSPEVKVSVGSAYALYTYDFFLERERERVRTYYARLGWTLENGIKLDASYAFEHDDLDDFHTLKVGATYSF